METWAYVFITKRYPKRNLPTIGKIPRMIHADALFGTPDIIAIVKGDDITFMDAVIDKIAEIDDIIGKDTKVARWLDGVGPPKAAN